MPPRPGPWRAPTRGGTGEPDIKDDLGDKPIRLANGVNLSKVKEPAGSRVERHYGALDEFGGTVGLPCYIFNLEHITKSRIEPPTDQDVVPLLIDHIAVVLSLAHQDILVCYLDPHAHLSRGSPLNTFLWCPPSETLRSMRKANSYVSSCGSIIQGTSSVGAWQTSRRRFPGVGIESLNQTYGPAMRFLILSASSSSSKLHLEG